MDLSAHPIYIIIARRTSCISLIEFRMSSGVFRCTDGVYRSTLLRCDCSLDCVDGSDELNCDGDSDDKRYWCADSQCVKHGRRCDCITDCSDGSDEADCPHIDCYTCDNNASRYGPVHRCDGDYTCYDGADEAGCSQYGALDDGRLFYETDRCNCYAFSREPDPDPADERQCDDYPYSNRFTCEDGYCTELHRRCDCYPDCYDGDDEEQCEGDPYNHRFYCSNGACIHADRRCDLTGDCLDGGDEDNCGGESTGEPSSHRRLVGQLLGGV